MPVAEHRTIADRFVLHDAIGDGRMSSVYLATDTASNNKVAVKLLNTHHPNSVKRALFQRETTALRRLRHPNIVRLHHSGWSPTERSFYLVLDYLPHSLEQCLGPGDGSSPHITLYPIIRQLAAAVAHAHSENVIHRDIKPSNILLTSDGTPMLADFGISKLFTDLTVGQTLAAYWSPGYASPEQRAGQRASTHSDVYSLGAVFYYMLSRTHPPPDGPTPDMVDQDINAPQPVKTTLKRMLDPQPESRPTRGAALLPLLDLTRRHDDLPHHVLILTSTAVRDLRTAGYSTGNSSPELSQALLDDLGGKEADDVHLNTDQHDDRGLILLGDSLRLICTRTPQNDALVVKAIQTPYGPHLDLEKARSMPYRAMWTPLAPDDHTARPSSATPLALRQLWMALKRHQTARRASNAQRRSRHEFIEHWDTALHTVRSRIERGAPPLRYLSAVEKPDYFQFTLAEPPPDGLLWEDDTRLAARESPDARPVPVGNLLSVRGKVVTVAKNTTLARGFRTDDSTVPSRGSLAIDVAEALAATTRQQQAVNAFLNDQMANPNVAQCIIDPATSTRVAEPTLEYFQDWLSLDKKQAVRRALSSGELFLIKGPPGTGKTAVIAEIALQILKHQPKARILLTSQSNVAVDHALSQIAKASTDQPPAMVRYGRAEKITDAGKHWTLGQRVRRWRKHVARKCDAVIEELRNAERALRRSPSKVDSPDPEHSDKSAPVQEWVAEAMTLAEQLREYKEELLALGTGVSTATRQTLEAAVTVARDELRTQLTALNGLLPEPYAPDQLASLTDEDALAAVATRAAAAAGPAVEAQTPQERERRRLRELRATITQWKSVAGLGADFAELVAKSARIVAATCTMSGKRKVLTADTSFDWAIVDEAGRATVPEVLIPIVQSERTILVGDERQLPPMLDETLRQHGTSPDTDALHESLFQSLLDQMREADGVAALRTQYRMHPAIGNLISTVFYDGSLQSGVSADVRERLTDLMPRAVTWLSTSSLPNRQEARRGQSYENRAEADIILRLLTNLSYKLGAGDHKVTVGVITGYSAQVETLTTRIDPDAERQWPQLEIEIATVDAFQGRERDLVVYSTVRSNSDYRIGFLRDYRRVNVALSRARELLVIVGDDRMMANASVGGSLNPFAAVLDYIRSKKNECTVVPAGAVRL